MTLISTSEFLAKAIFCDTMAVDVETNGQDIRDGRGFATGISAAVNVDGDYVAAYFPVAHTTGNVDDDTKEMLFKLIASRDIIATHNIKFDVPALKTARYTRGFKRLYCTMMMAHFLNENKPKKLDWLAQNVLNRPGKNKPPMWEHCFTFYGWSPDFPADVMALYAGEDAIICLQLLEKFLPHFKKWGFDGSEM